MFKLLHPTNFINTRSICPLVGDGRGCLSVETLSELRLGGGGGVHSVICFILFFFFFLQKGITNVFKLQKGINRRTIKIERDEYIRKSITREMNIISSGPRDKREAATRDQI